MDWHIIAEWDGLAYLAGALAGYAAFVLLQPCRWAFRESRQLAGDHTFIWLGVAMFAVARETFATARMILFGGIEVGDYLSAGALGLAPLVRDIAGSVLGETLQSLLRAQTVPVDAFPLSLLLVAGLLVNAGGVLSGLARSDAGRVTAWGIALTFGVVAAGLVHVVVSLRDFVPEWFGWIPPEAEPWLAPVGSFFAVALGFGVLVWALWWLVELGNEDDAPREANAAGAVTKMRSVWWVAVLIWVAVWVWQNADTGIVARAPNAWRFGAIVASWFLLVPLIQYLAGRSGYLGCFLGHQWGWWVAHWERFIWWGLMAGMHLFLLEYLAVAANEVISPLTIFSFGWNLFFALLRAGVVVWLLGALISLVLDDDSGLTDEP